MAAYASATLLPGPGLSVGTHVLCREINENLARKAMPLHGPRAKHAHMYSDAKSTKI